jgi:ABC-type phosphate transport system permease subunit
MQVEFMQQDNGGPSVVRDLYPEGSGGTVKRARLSQQQRRDMKQPEDDRAPRSDAWIVATVLLIVALAVGGAAFLAWRSVHLGIERSYEGLMVCTQWHGPNPVLVPMCQREAAAPSGLLGSFVGTTVYSMLNQVLSQK